MIVKSKTIFPTKYIHTNILNDIDILGLRSECNEYSNVYPSRTLSNQGGYQSDDILISNLVNTFPIFTKLTDNIQHIIDHLSKDVMSYPIKLNNMWLNINHKYHFNWSHQHAPAVLAGTFYVNVPKDSQSSFVFERDDVFLQSAYHIWSEGSKYRDSADDAVHGLLPENGDLIIFPGHLKHRVTPNLSNEERISISFNIL